MGQHVPDAYHVVHHPLALVLQLDDVQGLGCALEPEATEQKLLHVDEALPVAVQQQEQRAHIRHLEPQRVEAAHQVAVLTHQRLVHPVEGHGAVIAWVQLAEEIVQPPDDGEPLLRGRLLLRGLVVVRPVVGDLHEDACYDVRGAKDCEEDEKQKHEAEVHGQGRQRLEEDSPVDASGHRLEQGERGAPEGAKIGPQLCA
mmetsp:Transcript_35593/g.99980  ORF Transcript_35593/g.99980 Transcript_35593/m.99980 type:complete len:200 (+) Transcript_35593:399-998(+)